MTTPTTIVIGAAIAMVHVITTSIWTCCTSLVIRVISDGAPNAPTSGGELGDLVEEGLAQVATEAHGDLAAEVHGADGEHDLEDREGDHEGAGRPDVADVTGDDALVDDVGVERRQGQRRGRLHRRQRDDAQQHLAVRTEVRSQQSDQHGGLSAEVP
jgi:hypothetical protein